MQGFVYDCGPCPYLPGREFHAFHPEPNPPTEVPYRVLLDHRFRRSGDHLYMPMCPSCDACQPLRVDVEFFAPRKDQRRCAARNADVSVSWQARGMDGERRNLFARYQRVVHGKEPEGDEDPAAFLAQDGGIPGGELHARDREGKLLAVSVCDRFADALSSVYCYYEPEMRERALGTFMALAEIAHAKESGMRWLYLGFLVRECRKMAYKARFLPNEVLIDGTWVRHN